MVTLPQLRDAKRALLGALRFAINSNRVSLRQAANRHEGLVAGTNVEHVEATVYSDVPQSMELRVIARVDGELVEQVAYLHDHAFRPYERREGDPEL